MHHAMSNWFYNMVWCIGSPAFIVSASPVVLHRDRARRQGPWILAANHLSPYDVSCLIRETPRILDFVSVVEVFRKPLVAWFFRNMGAFPLDRGRVDTGTTRIILDRLRRGRVVAMFPEGRVRKENESLLNGAPFKPGVLRLARLAGVPILPCVILGTAAYHRFSSWLPLRRTIYAINYGMPIEPADTADDEELLQKLREAYQALYAELRAAITEHG